MELNELRKKLHDFLSKISTFEAYVSELRSGTLEWTPLHKSSLFWKNNVARFDENNYECLRLLLTIISTPKGSSNVLISLNDIQNYINFKAKPKKFIFLNCRILEELGLKSILIKLMENNDEDIRYQSLLCMQKFLCSAW